MKLIKREEIKHGECLIDVYRAPGDLYDSWKICSIESGESPNAGYGPDANDRAPSPSKGEIVEVTERWNRNGHTVTETTIYLDGYPVASSGGSL